MPKKNLTKIGQESRRRSVGGHILIFGREHPLKFRTVGPFLLTARFFYLLLSSLLTEIGVLFLSCGRQSVWSFLLTVLPRLEMGVRLCCLCEHKDLNCKQKRRIQK